MGGKLVKISENRNNNGNTSENTEKGEFRRIARHIGGHWFAAAFLKGMYLSGRFTKEGLQDFKNLEGRIKNSKLDSEEKKMLAKLYRDSDMEDGWDTTFTYDIITYRLKGSSSMEETEYNIELLKAWREDRMEKFAKEEMVKLRTKELPKEVKEAFTKMLMVGVNTSKLGAAEAVKNLIDIQYSNEKTDKKLKKMRDAIKIIGYL